MKSITIATPAAFRFRTTLLSHGWLELLPFYHDETFTSLDRIERLSDGTVVRLRMQNGVDGSLEVDTNGAVLTGAQQAEIERVVHRIFNLDLDLQPFYERLEGLERYDWIAEHGGGRLLRSSTIWEDLAKTLLTTNTTWTMTRQMVGRLTEIGDAYAGGGHAFPTPEQIASMDPDELAEQVRAGYRNNYLHRLAVSIAEKKVDVESWARDHLPAEDLYKQIRSLRGFGPYAAGATLKLLGRFDQLALDSAARSMFAREFNGGAKASDADIIAHYQAYEEWKGLVIWMDLMRAWFRSQFESK